MKTIKIIIISLLVGLNLTSCDFLEKDPTYTTPENFFKNEADATSWLTGTYAILGQSSFYGNEFLYLVGGDDLGHYGGANRGPNKSGLICNNANTSDPAVAALWYTLYLSLIHISEPTRLGMISYAVFCLKKKKKKKKKKK